MHQYEDSLRATKRLLDAVGEGGWARWMETCIGRWQAAHDTACHLSAYGGMGSFNDILICEANGHKVTRLQEPWANTLFDWLSALLFPGEKS